MYKIAIHESTNFEYLRTAVTNYCIFLVATQRPDEANDIWGHYTSEKQRIFDLTIPQEPLHTRRVTVVDSSLTDYDT